MKFEWRKPDRTEVVINHPDKVTEVMNDLKARHDDATKAGLKMKAAALEVQYDQQYEQWLLCMALYYQDERKELGDLIKRSKQTLAWWNHSAAQDEGVAEVSELQRSLLKGLPADLWPHSWAEAAAIINRNPEFRVPVPDLGIAIQYLTEVIASASSCLEMAGDLATKFYQGENPGQHDLNNYRAKRMQLNKELANVAGS